MKKEITIYYSPTCPYCNMALEFLSSELPDIALEKIELSGEDMADRRRFAEALKKCGSDSHGVPLIIVNGKQCFQGFDDETANGIKHALDH